MEATSSVRSRRKQEHKEISDIDRMFENNTVEHLSNHDEMIARLQEDVSEIHVTLAKSADKSDISDLKDRISDVEKNILERIIAAGNNRISTWWMAIGSVAMVVSATFSIWVVLH